MGYVLKVQANEARSTVFKEFGSATFPCDKLMHINEICVVLSTVFHSMIIHEISCFGWQR